ncbi:MAG: glycoside hydrolase family 71/99-like protein [Anaerolineae bacterium]
MKIHRLLVALLMGGFITAMAVGKQTVQAQERTPAPSRPLLLTHYMPWYQAPPINPTWGWHWTMNHFNPNHTGVNGLPELASHTVPLTGPYDSRDETVLEYQVLTMKLSGIDGVIVDWYGTSDYEDYAAVNTATGRLFDAIARAGMRFIICYEDRTLLNMTGTGVLDADQAVVQGQADMQYVHEQWMSQPAYVTYEDQPLLFVYGPLYFRQPDNWTALFTGIDPTPALVTLDRHMEFAALASYPWPPMHMAGGIELPPAVIESYLELFYRNARRHPITVGSAFPGFEDIYEQAGVRSSYGSIAPRDGETLRYTLDTALAQNPYIVQLVTWNDYGEGTTIEPTHEYGYHYLETIQAARQTLDATFTATPDDLRLPLRLFEARRAHQGDDAINAELDRAFDAIVAGDLAAAASILDTIAPAS